MVDTCETHFHGRIISLRGEAYAHETSLTRNFLLQFLHQARKESDSALGVSIYVFDSVLDFETVMSVVYFFFHFKIIEKKHVIVAN